MSPICGFAFLFLNVVLRFFFWRVYLCHNILINRRSIIVLCDSFGYFLHGKCGHSRTSEIMPMIEMKWRLVWSCQRFKKTFWVSKATFILNNTKHDLQHQTVTENPISPEMRLGICLYRLGRGDYNYTTEEMAGVRVSTVSAFVREVSE